MRPRIRHIAITSENPRETADFYRDIVGLEEVGTHHVGAVFLSDGFINVAVIPVKLATDADVGKLGPGFTGLHHFGFEVEDAVATSERLIELGVKSLDGDYVGKTSGQLHEIKWEGPEGVVFDTSQSGWKGAHG